MSGLCNYTSRWFYETTQRLPSSHLEFCLFFRAQCAPADTEPGRLHEHPSPRAGPLHPLHVGPLLSRPTCLMNSSDSDTCSSNNFWPQESYFSINGGTLMCQTDLSPQGVTATQPGTSAPTSRYHCCALWSAGRSTGGESCFKLSYSSFTSAPLGPRVVISSPGMRQAPWGGATKKISVASALIHRNILLDNCQREETRQACWYH